MFSFHLMNKAAGDSDGLRAQGTLAEAEAAEGPLGAADKTVSLICVLLEIARTAEGIV